MHTSIQTCTERLASTQTPIKYEDRQDLGSQWPIPPQTGRSRSLLNTWNSTFLSLLAWTFLAIDYPCILLPHYRAQILPGLTASLGPWLYFWLCVYQVLHTVLHPHLSLLIFCFIFDLVYVSSLSSFLASVFPPSSTSYAHHQGSLHMHTDTPKYKKTHTNTERHKMMYTHTQWHRQTYTHI